MTREDIIRMAREAGFTDGELAWHDHMLEHFAALVAAEKREACAKVCEEFVMGSPFATAIRARG
jgi:hypothetical protein